MEGKKRQKEEWKAGKEGEKEGRMERRKMEHRDRITLNVQFSSVSNFQLS